MSKEHYKLEKILDKYKNIEVFPYQNTKDDESIFPAPLRCLIVGSSGSGKTNLLWNIITNFWIPFENLYIFTKTIDQPIYEKLEEVFNGIDEIETVISNEGIVSVDECKKNSLVIFDDCVLENQSIMKEYFIRGRHKKISSIYLTQSYTAVDLKIIRNNLNFVIIFKQPDHYIKKIWEDFISDNRLNTFKSLCNTCWKESFGFLSMDLTNKHVYKRFDQLLCKHEH